MVLQRCVYELRGVDCIPLEAARTVRDQLIPSRSLATLVTTIADMEQVLSVYAQRAVRRLRAQGSVTKIMSVFIPVLVRILQIRRRPRQLSHPHRRPGRDRRGRDRNAPPAPPRRRTVCPRGRHPHQPLPQEPPRLPRSFDNAFDTKGLGATIDAVTKRHGRSVVGLRLAGIRKGPVWTMKRGVLSPRSSARWAELATAIAR